MTTEVPEQSYNLSESKEAQSIPYFTRLIRVDRVGFEPTTSAPSNFLRQLSLYLPHLKGFLLKRTITTVSQNLK